MRSITSVIRDLADILKFAAALDIEGFKKIVEKLHAILEEKKNFEPTPEAPLKFSPQGIEKLKGIEGYDFSKQTDLMAVLKRLTTILEFAGKAGNPELVQLYKNLNRPGYWTKTPDLKNKDFDHAQTQVERTVFDFALDQAKRELEHPDKSRVSPQELQEMKERGVI